MNTIDETKRLNDEYNKFMAKFYEKLADIDREYQQLTQYNKDRIRAEAMQILQSYHATCSANDLLQAFQNMQRP